LKAESTEFTILKKGEFFYVPNPNNARIFIYEKYTYPEKREYLYSERGYNYEKSFPVTVYFPAVEITIVDMVAQKTLFQGTKNAVHNEKYLPSQLNEGDFFVVYDFFDRNEFLTEELKGLIN
jgi:hypothetical protein